ncbi:glyoxalase/bleomycin resistance/dioxygenase family protein [Pectobacterium atrosepticum]|uniref:VOC family protein n=1 Tax=Pectobacterium atrosepticum TaxID=29471 RepID=UPI0003A433BF|nr:glyoxalase/bleomycin resistance/dioxygenase family protein [Pectobacterium atrosepticum]GKV84893.1 glyoxalase [Pectobacterium carotovorum subsp. carotovorum]AIA71637.1 glyoxalase [Pectobacterium atrosepticum]AIK13560.1 putative glyoxalase/bleomycin resistance protein/dioxygenase [Pectobacterium atrosepticum]ATY90445.1 glyoxalase/bleomycin resistance/dioxygenase family protein [Pectobacterium atrosepticum]KFX16336.1 glyoxalase [Pectobacterium atrosepticum]
MTPSIPGVDVLFVAGFGPIVTSLPASYALYVDTLKLPLKPVAEGSDYLVSDVMDGVKHFALWPLSHASESCFGQGNWPADLPEPQSWLEFEVADMAEATEALKVQGYALLVENRLEPWGQQVTRFLSPEGILIGVTYTPWLRD